MNNGNITPRAPFKSEAAFVRHVGSYLDMCEGVTDAQEGGDLKGRPPKRIANAAGFCAYCRLTGDEYRRLRTLYPRSFEIMQLHFIDAAVNNKIVNSGPVMDYLLNNVNRLCDGDEYALTLEQDIGEDGV